MRTGDDRLHAPELVDEHGVVFEPLELTMLRAVILIERWGDWVGIGLALLIGLTPLLVGLPRDEALVLRSALVGVSVWGCP